MPYVITMTLDLTDEQAPDIISRTAVATLEEAREAAADVIGDWRENPDRSDDEPGNVAYCRALALDLPESGGTVGPLPDGTVIEVRRVDWMDFERMVVPGPVAATVPITTFDSDEYRDGLIRAFNAR